METQFGRQPEIESLELIPKTKHLCWIYETDESRFLVVEPYLISCLAKRKRCVLSVPKAAAKLILDGLVKEDINVKRYQESGQLVIIDPKEMFFATDRLDVDVVMHGLNQNISDALAQGWQGLAVVSDASELLDKASEQDWLALEFRADFECYTKPCTLLCLYDARLASGTLLAAMIKAHPVIGLGQTLAHNPFYMAKTMHSA